MALYDRSYQSWEGTVTPPWKRFWIVTRYSFSNVFYSRFAYNFYIFSLLVSLIPLCLIYVRANLDMFLIFNAPSAQFPTIDAHFFHRIFAFQSSLCWILVFLMAPDLFIHDLKLNALMLYFTRPLSKCQYLFGKALVLFAIQATVLIVPLEIQFIFHCLVTKQTNFWAENSVVIWSIPAAALLFITFTTALSLAVVALAKTKQRARVVMIIIYIMSNSVDVLIKLLFHSDLGKYLNIGQLFRQVRLALFGLEHEAMLFSSVMIGLMICLAVLILERTLKPFHYQR